MTLGCGEGLGTLGRLMMMRPLCWLGMWLGLLAGGLPAWGDDRGLADALAVLRAVGAEGQGNEAASQAWKRVAAAESPALPLILDGLRGANDYAVNWILLAAETVAARGQVLPQAELGRLLLDTRQHPRAREYAFRLLANSIPAVAERLLAGFLADPAPGLRREAVERVFREGESALKRRETNAAVLFYQQGLGAARDAEQMERAGKQLKELGQPVDLGRVFGFLRDWRVIGPFDNSTNSGGFSAVYPPERGLDLGAEHPGKSGAVRWKMYRSADEMGVIDLNQAVGALKEVTGYATTEVEVPEARPVELRLACKNAWKLWLNGVYVLGREEYHMGMEIDQYRLPVTLRKGKNTLLVKLGQNEMKEDWTVEWQFQLRITDALGTPVELGGAAVAAGH